MNKTCLVLPKNWNECFVWSDRSCGLENLDTLKEYYVCLASNNIDFDARVLGNNTIICSFHDANERLNMLKKKKVTKGKKCIFS